jgi:hypothetical protein
MKKAVILLVGSLICGQAFGMEQVGKYDGLETEKHGYIPREIVQEMASFFDTKTMGNCLSVCSNLKSAIEGRFRRLFGEKYKDFFRVLLGMASHFEHGFDDVLTIVYAAFKKDKEMLQKMLDVWNGKLKRYMLRFHPDLTISGVRKKFYDQLKSLGGKSALDNDFDLSMIAKKMLSMESIPVSYNVS